MYEKSSRDIVAAVEMLLNQKALAIQDTDAVTGALETFRKRPAPGFSDCLLLEVARKLDGAQAL